MFEITIKEIKTERKVVRGEYTVVEKRPFTDEELSASSNWRQTESARKGEMKSIYGYAPEFEKDVLSEREILKQTVESLDLPAVIKAINGI